MLHFKPADRNNFSLTDVGKMKLPSGGKEAEALYGTSG